MTQLFRLYKHTITPEQAREKFDEYQVHYEKNLALYPDVIACLESLKTTKLGIISNGKSRLQMKKLEDTGIIKYFEVFAIAETAGFKKPDKGIFEYACAMAKCAPAEAVFIGDKLEVDAIAGKNAGLKTFWLNRSGNGSFMIQGLREISGLENLKNVLTEEPIRPKNICFMPDDIG
jgi:putative hydrolase of the HAD superfamily